MTSTTTIRRTYLGPLPPTDPAHVAKRFPSAKIAEGRTFSGVVFSETVPAPEVGLRGVVYVACDFEGCTVRGRIEFCHFTRCTFHKCVFLGPKISKSSFEECAFVRNAFTHSTEFHDVRLTGCYGLHRNNGLHTVQVHEEGRVGLDTDLRGAPLPPLERWASWERLRTFGGLPLFGVSFSALVAIPTVTFLLAAYNEQIGRIRDWTNAHATDLPVATSQLAQLAGRLHPVPLPSLTFWLLVSTVLLGVASTLYAVVCPPRVKEFSLERWTAEFHYAALHYLPLSWQHRSTRAVAWTCYVAGGLGTLVILVVKLWNAGEFVITNTTLPWYKW